MQFLLDAVGRTNEDNLREFEQSAAFGREADVGFQRDGGDSFWDPAMAG
jgi:hypothetical protein